MPRRKPKLVKPKGAPWSVRVKNALKQKSMLAVLIATAAITGYLVLVLLQVPIIRTGENHHYGIYINDTRMGTYDQWIEGETTVEGTRAFIARYIERYAIGTDNYGRAGRMTFKADGGQLRHCKTAFAKNQDLLWATEIAYSPTLSVMQVIFENYEDNTSSTENFIGMQRETTVLEHLNYLLRLEPLRQGYARKLDLNIFPNATNTVTITFEVTGEDIVQVPAGSFDSWAVGSDQLAITIWVAKDGRTVPMIEERMSGGGTWRYKLESF